MSDVGYVGFEPPAVDKTPRVSRDDPKSYDAVPFGSKYYDPEGNTRYKPIRGEQDYRTIPEGEQYADPSGTVRQKPKFEGIDFTAQTLYDMSVTPSEKRKALERSYPGKVKEDQEGLYIDDNGKFRRPGRGMSAVTGFAASAAAPTVGAVLGTLGGGAAGTLIEPGGGTFAGGVAGAAGGSVGGQMFNDAILQLAGIYDRTLPEEAANVGMAAASGIAGAGVGRGVATLVPAAKAGVSSLTSALPTLTAKFLGAAPAETHMARELSEKGVLVPPSAWAHESPHLQNIVEVFDPAFRTNKPLRESATDYYEKQAIKVLDDLGVKREDSIVAPKAAVPTQVVGEKIMQRTLAESAAADQALKAALEKRAANLKAGLPDQMAQREALTKTAEASREQAQKLIDQSFESIQQEADHAMKVAQAGANTGQLWDNIGKKLALVRRGIGERAQYWYDRYDQMTAGFHVNSEELAETAKQMLDELPAEFKTRNPALVQKLSQLEGPLTYGQLHDLRSMFRGAADWHTLSSDFKNGALKRFSNEIDRLIHDPNAPDQVKIAGQFLDRVDKWYGHNISIFESQQIKAITKGLEAGEPADPKNLYKVLVKEGHSDLIRRVRDMVGPNLWAGVKAADTQAMLDASKSLTPGVIDAKKFAREVLERHRANVLEVVHGKEASEKLLAQARAIEQLDGRLPIPIKPDDTMTQVIVRARLAADEARAAGAKDPLGTLNKEMKKITAEHSREVAKLRAERRNDPLGFLYDPTTGASEAVDRILGNEDLILAAAARFGEKSPEFNMLRQVYAQRILESGLRPSVKLEKIAPEVQQLMFPGTTLKQLQMLAKEMDFLMTRRGMASSTAGGMSAMSKVEHPVGGKFLGPILGKIPIVNPAGRAVLGKFYALITGVMTSPTTLRWIEKGLTSGTPEEKEAVRQILRKHLQRGAAMGAGAGEAIEQGGI